MENEIIPELIKSTRRVLDTPAQPLRITRDVSRLSLLNNTVYAQILTNLVDITIAYYSKVLKIIPVTSNITAPNNGTCYNYFNISQ